MSESNWVGSLVSVDCDEIGNFEGKVVKIDNLNGYVKLENGR